MTTMTQRDSILLRDYVRTGVLNANPGIRVPTHRRLVSAADKFCDWLGEEIAASDVTPEMIEEFTDATRQYIGRDLRTVMRYFDPFKFKIKGHGNLTRRVALATADGSEFLLANLYLNRYEPTALRSRRHHTKRLYRTTLAMFDRFLGRSATLDDLTDDTVGRFAAWRRDGGLSKASVNKDLFNLLALWRWLHRKGMVEEWPDIEMEKPPKRTPVAWTDAEIRHLYATLLELPGRVGNIRACLWWPALLLVAWDSGERINAILNLKWSNVDTRRKWIRFEAEYRKGGREDNAMRISDDTARALRMLPKDRDEVFPWPRGYTYLWKKFGKILKLAGLPNDSRCKFHRIRRTVASYAEAAGANATAMLKHTKREITEAYLDPRVTKPQQPVDVLFRLPV